MGIKGIYKEIGPGKRVSLARLAVEKLEQSGRPFRLAIDISIWQFQTQAARGGVNPAIRTLFYRLLRLLGLSIQPIFVFDGPKKPSFKRNKRSSGRGDAVATSMAKRMIRLFGFKVHDAPGEAEAECALLQQRGIVDAVLSEDVDTIMFGCTRTLRNWSAEGVKGSKTPTHVSMYETEDIRTGPSGLDREGMVLVALMSGGDYLPEGIPGAGVKLACEAAKAGFGKTLCQLKRSDTSELASWREWLMYELRTNEGGFFRTRHKALNVPEDFPNMEILRYYTHPVVSPATTLDSLRTEKWGNPLDILGLREFARETFDWTYRIGAIKFIRVLAPCLLVRQLTDRGQCDDPDQDEMDLVNAISSQRTHFSTDSISELRVSFIPTKIVGYNFEEEPDEVISYGRDGLALNSDDEFEAVADGDEAEASTQSRPKKVFSPTEPDLLWIPEMVVRQGAPTLIIDWDERQRQKALKKTQKTKPSKPKAKPSGTETGAMDRFVKITKPTRVIPSQEKTQTPKHAQANTQQIAGPLFARPPSPFKDPPVQPQSIRTFTSSTKQLPDSRATRTSKQTKSASTKKAATASKPASNTNPWTLAGSHSNPRVTKTTETAKAIIISSSPPASPPEAASSPVKYKESRGSRTSTPTSPHKRRSMTPPSDLRVPENAPRASSPTPLPATAGRRKLARTESMPVTRVGPSEVNKDGSKSKCRTLTRAKTMAAPTATDDEEDDDDFPTLSQIVNKIPKGKTLTENSSHHPLSTSSLPAKSKSGPSPQDPSSSTSNHQSTLDDAFGGRKTKLYVPRKSEPGFFKELDVTVEEADRMKSNSGGRTGDSRAWRRSDVSVIDLTGED